VVDFKEKLLAGLLAVLFIVGVASAFKRESAQANLKIGIRLNEKNNPSAIALLQSGIRKNPDHYLLYVTLAESLQKKAFALLADGKSAKTMLLKARRSIEKALALRFDSHDYFLLGYNYELEGAPYAALAHYNVSFFFSQNEKELERWETLRTNQAKTAAEYFRVHSASIAMMMVYNHLVDFKERPPATPAEVFISNFFLSVPPDEWLSSNPEDDRRRLKELFHKLAPAQKDELERAFENAGFGFLARFLAT